MSGILAILVLSAKPPWPKAKGIRELEIAVDDGFQLIMKECIIESPGPRNVSLCMVKAPAEELHEGAADVGSASSWQGANVSERAYFPSRLTAFPPDRPDFGTVVVIFFLLAVGSLLVWIGKQAIQTRHYESKWEQSLDASVGPIEISASKEYGVDRFEGADAERVGIGIAALGSMLILWGVAGTWTGVRPARVALGPSICSWLCVLSALLQTTTLVCIFPPWKWGSGTGPILWIAMPFLGGAVFTAAIDGADIFRRRRFWKIIISIIAISAVVGVAVNSPSRCVFGFPLAVFFVVSYTAHFVALRVFMSRTQYARVHGCA